MRRAPRHMASAALLSFAAVTTAFTQTPAPQTPGQATTIVGCLVQRPTPTAGEFFVRTPAIAVPAGTKVTVGEPAPPTSSGRATTSAGTPAATTLYRVTGLSAGELTPHLNHRIEVSGRVSQTAPATTATTTQDPKTGRATTAVKDDWTVAGVIEATSMKMIAATCQ